MKHIKTYENIVNSNKFLDITKLKVGEEYSSKYYDN